MTDSDPTTTTSPSDLPDSIQILAAIRERLQVDLQYLIDLKYVAQGKPVTVPPASFDILVQSTGKTLAEIRSLLGDVSVPTSSTISGGGPESPVNLILERLRARQSQTMSEMAAQSKAATDELKSVRPFQHVAIPEPEPSVPTNPPEAAP